MLIQSEQLTTLNEQFDEASSVLASTNRKLSQIAGEITLTKFEVAAERSRLRRDAIDQFTEDAPASQLNLLFDASASQIGIRSQYMGVILGSTSADLSRLRSARGQLDTLRAHLRSTQRSETATVSQLRSARNAATAASATEQATLASVKGRLATEIALQAAAQARAATLEAQQAASAAQRRAADEVAAQSSLLATTIGSEPIATSPTTPSPPPPAVPGSSAGAIAVRAAESQLGVPYVWGGATPGVGFDCSGLTMWAWAQAGVQLAHFAATQYTETTHVSLSSLQPGDLLFYDFGGNGIDHVTMYVGSGPYGSSTIIQAAHTGTAVMFSPIWYSGLVGAGRP
jgi:cell wall-associated NlpC family hydrolase